MRKAVDVSKQTNQYPASRERESYLHGFVETTRCRGERMAQVEEEAKSDW